MKLSTKGRYGLRAMVDLAVYSEKESVSISCIAQREEQHFQPGHQRQPRFHRSGLRPVRTRQGFLRPLQEGPQQVRPLPRREARRRRHSTSPLFFPILKSHSGRPRFQTESRPPAFHVRRLPLLNSEIAGGGAFAWAARHVEADCHDDEHHRAADPQHTAAERVENPTSDQRRERVRQRPHQVV